MQMKKCLVLKEMNTDDCLEKFKDLRISVRRSEKKIP